MKADSILPCSSITEQASTFTVTGPAVLLRCYLMEQNGQCTCVFICQILTAFKNIFKYVLVRVLMTDPPCSFTHLLDKPFPKGKHIPANSCILPHQQKFPISRHSKEGPQRAVGTQTQWGNWPSAASSPNSVTFHTAMTCQGAEPTRPHQGHCPLSAGPWAPTDLFLHTPHQRPGRD